MRRGNPGLLRFFKDDDSYTGTSAAILLRNIRPNRLRGDTVKLASADFLANFKMNCEGFRVRPNVTVLVQCKLNKMQMDIAKKRRRTERALAMSPELK